MPPSCSRSRDDHHARRSSSRLWQARSAPEEYFISVAASHWEMVVTRQRGGGSADRARSRDEGHDRADPRGRRVLRHPVQPRHVHAEPAARAPRRSVGDVAAGDGHVVLAQRVRMGTAGPDNVDVFIDRLVRAGVLAHDPVASAAVLGDVDGLSTRSMQRRVSRATGLTRGAIGQIRRAETAVDVAGPRHVRRRRGVPSRDTRTSPI